MAKKTDVPEVNLEVDEYQDLDHFRERVDRQSRPYYGFVQKDGDWVMEPIGALIRDRMDSGKYANSYFFMPAGRDKEYPLGTLKSDEVIDQRPLVNPFLEAGWQVAEHHTLRGGCKAMTVLNQPEIQWADQLKWDVQRHAAAPSFLNPAVMVSTDPRRGTKLRIRAGYLRLVCTNGLVASVLELGEVSFSHGTDELKVREKVNRFVDQVMGVQDPWSLNLKEYGKDTLTWYVKTLSTPEEEMASLPNLINSQVRSAVSAMRTSSRLSDFTMQLRELVDQDDFEPITIFDIINAYTNLSHDYRAWDALDRFVVGSRDLLELGDYVSTNV